MAGNKVDNAKDSKQEQLNNEIIGKKHKKIPNAIYNVVRVFAILFAGGILIYASYNLTESYLNYKEDEKKYAQINQMFIKDDEEKTTEKSQDNKSIRYTKSVSTWKWDYKEMLQYNDEAKGYIKLNGTRIQYPIVEHSDNDFYLKRGSDKVYNGAGAIFLDYRTAGLDGKMCILYGHNMLDGSMFKELMNFRDDDFCRKHPTFDIYVGYRHYIYYVFSVFSDKDDNENIYKYGFANDGEFQSWINTVSSRSRYNYGVRKPDTSDKIIMCSTCVDDNGNRQIVCLYRGEEVVD